MNVSISETENGVCEFRPQSVFSPRRKSQIFFSALMFRLEERRLEIKMLFHDECNSCVHMSASLTLQHRNRIPSLKMVPHILTLQQKQKSNTS
jgi:hypothetical protein